MSGQSLWQRLIIPSAGRRRAKAAMAAVRQGAFWQVLVNLIITDPVIYPSEHYMFLRFYPAQPQLFFAPAQL
jgi:hypothetical protein